MRHDIGFLFDLDGVLIDSERRYTTIWQQIESEFPTNIPDFPRVIKGMTLHNILARFYPDAEVRRHVERRCLEAEKLMDYNYMPGAEELLKSLREAEIPVAMVTSSDNLKMESLRRKLPGIFRWFTAVVDGDMVTNGKPHPEPYLTGAMLLDVKPQHCIVVEDALTGIEAGHRAGAFVVGMTDTLGREAIEPKADVTLDSLEEIDIDTLIKKLKQRKS